MNFQDFIFFGLLISKARLELSAESPEFGITWSYASRVQNKVILLNYLLNVLAIDCTSLLLWVFNMNRTLIVKGILLFSVRLVAISKDGIKKEHGTNHWVACLLPVKTAITSAMSQRTRSLSKPKAWFWFRSDCVQRLLIISCWVSEDL